MAMKDMLSRRRDTGVFDARMARCHDELEWLFMELMDFKDQFIIFKTHLLEQSLKRILKNLMEI